MKKEVFDALVQIGKALTTDRTLEIKEERERIVKLVKRFNKKLYKIINNGNPITWRLINDSIDNLIVKIIAESEAQGK